MNKRLLIIFLILAISPLFFFLVILPAQAATAKSNCVITKIGDVGDRELPANLPPECYAIDGIEMPPNLDLATCITPLGTDPLPPEKPDGIAGRYCKMPPSLDGAYVLKGGNWGIWGSQEMIGTLYTVSKAWKQKYPQGTIYVIYITIYNVHKKPNSEHDWGVSVDLNATTNGGDCVADMRHSSGSICQDGPYNKEATLELAKMFFDTGFFNITWYNDPDVSAAFCEYAHSKDPNKFPTVSGCTSAGDGTGLRYVDGHYHHFHFMVDRTPERGSNRVINFNRSKLPLCVNVGGIC